MIPVLAGTARNGTSTARNRAAAVFRSRKKGSFSREVAAKGLVWTLLYSGVLIDDAKTRWE